MQKQSNIRILEILKYLYLRTDEEHPVTVADILDYLNGKGIHAVRQTVYGDLQDLILAGVDIVVTKSTQNQYFIGNRLFEYPELKMLTDAVASSKVISAEKTNELIQKLCRLTSEAEAMQLRRLAAISSRIKPHNEKVYYIIDGVQNAILENRQIQFQYYEYTQQKERVLKHNGYFYKLDPYALEWKNDHYYLIGYSHKHHGMAHFRVDRLAGIEILESTYVPQPDFDVADYFRIRSSYRYDSGWPDKGVEHAFRDETRTLFQSAGWELHPAREGSSSSDIVTKGQQDLYLHPMNFSGVIQTDEIPRLQELLEGAQTFQCQGVDCYERYWELTDAEYLKQLEDRRDEIIEAILERYQTKRKNLYVTGPAELSIAKQFSVHRLCDKDGKNNLANRYVGELVERLIREGRLVTAETRNGLGIRTAAGEELRQRGEPLPGQQQMTL